jgi:mannose-6-phosphate isomerase-like protein (cupin superfamily)
MNNPLIHFGIKKEFIRGDTNSYNDYDKCSGCGQTSNNKYLRNIGNKKYCPDCYNEVSAMRKDKSSRNLNTPRGEVHQPYIGNVEKQTKNNNYYRDTLFTGKHSQLIVMDIKPRQSIGNEVHPHVDQFFRIEQGKAAFNIDNGKTRVTEGNGGAVIVPSGHYHNVTNPSKTRDLKLYTIYSPSNHPPLTKQKTRPKND